VGNKLFAEIMELTGLPEEVIGKELKSLLELKGVEPHQLTMDSLRDALQEYLKQVSNQMEQEASANDSESDEAMAFSAMLSSAVKLPAQ
jgi:hypothetical protein